MKPDYETPEPKPYGGDYKDSCEDDGIQGGPIDDKTQPWIGPPPPPPPRET